MIDRSIAPEIHAISSITFPDVQSITLSNHIPLHVLASGQQDVAKIEIIFLAGRTQEHKRAVATATASLLKEGTSNRSSLDIANLIDFYGASIQVKSYIDYTSLTLFCLTKHLDYLLPLMAELIQDATFPESELQLYVRNQKQKIEVNEMKVEYLGQRLFTSTLFGTQHPIGYSTSKTDLEALTRDDLVQYKDQYYTHQNAFIMASGKLDKNHLVLINKYLGVPMNKHTVRDNISPALSAAPAGLYVEEKADAMQSAIRVGKRFINKLHPDYPLVKAANLILGEYFGSRLMSNLREDKGYCYGVYSSIASFINDAYLCISTEVGVDVTEEALNEIDIEILRLQNELVNQDELQAAINYRMGVFLGDLDGAFNQHEYLKGLYLFGADKEYAMQYIQTLRSATPQQIRDMAQKYYTVDNMYKVVAGKNVKAVV
jgi:predicted Zn-dependent peptidase